MRQLKWFFMGLDHVAGSGFPLELFCPLLRELAMSPSHSPGTFPITPTCTTCHALLIWLSRCVAVWGPPRENPGHRPNNRVFHMFRFVFLSLPITLMRCILWFGQQLGLPSCDALLEPVLLRKHQSATSRYLGWVFFGMTSCGSSFDGT